MIKGKEERQVALFFLMMSAIWAYLTLKVPAATVAGTPGPRFFPWMLVAGLGVLSLVMFFQSSSKRDGEKSSEVPGAPKKGVDWIGIGTLVMFFMYIKLLDLIGFRLSTLLMMPVFLYISFRVRNLWQIGLLTVILSFGVDFIFRVVLNMALPIGRLF